MPVSGKDRIAHTGKGTCNACGKSVASDKFTSHLKTHITDKKKGTYYVIRVRGESIFWMFLQVRSTCTLEDLDAFLRREWLECCGHMSCFNINRARYEIYPNPELGTKSMKYAISKVLGSGMTFEHEYDYGTSTYLELVVKGKDMQAIRLPSKAKPGKIEVLARHDPIRFVCDTCGGDATQICGLCTIEEPGSLLCDKCVKKHQCQLDGEDEETLLPAVQSPRAGLCGYTGP